MSWTELPTTPARPRRWDTTRPEEPVYTVSPRRPVVPPAAARKPHRLVTGRKSKARK